MVHGQPAFPLEIGNRTRHTKNTVMRAGRQVQALAGLFQQPGFALTQLAVGSNAVDTEAGIDAAAFGLDRARLDHTLANALGRLARRAPLERLARHFDLQVDPVEERPRDAIAIALEIGRASCRERV